MEAREPLLMKLNAQKIDWPIVFWLAVFGEMDWFQSITESGSEITFCVQKSLPTL